MSIDSFAEIPVVPVYPTHSDPARSTSYNFETTTSSIFAGSIVSKVTVKIACERLEA
jgi:hypothetical protein